MSSCNPCERRKMPDRAIRTDAREALLHNGTSPAPRHPTEPEHSTIIRKDLLFCEFRSDSCPAHVRSFCAHVATMLEIEVTTDDLAGLNSKQRTTPPMCNELASAFDCNVGSV